MVAVLLKWDTVFCQSKKSLVTKSKLTMLITQESNESKRWVAEAGNTILSGKHADQEDGRLMSQNSLLLGLDGRFFYRTERGRSSESKVKMSYVLQISPGIASLREGICSFLPSCSYPQMNRVRMFPWTKALRFSIQAEGQGSQRQAIMYRQYPFSEQMQWEAKIKVKKRIQPRVRFCSYL